MGRWVSEPHREGLQDEPGLILALPSPEHGSWKLRRQVTQLIPHEGQQRRDDKDGASQGCGWQLIGQ